MTHISYSELKDWAKCPFYHKLAHLDSLRKFEGNEYTAFGSALHDTCEKLLIETKKNNNFNIDESAYFEKQFRNRINSLNSKGLNQKLLSDMKEQGLTLAKEILPGIKKRFGNFELISAEEQLMIPIKEYVEEEYDFKGYIDLVIKTKDGKYHVIDWKTCSWGWDARKKNDSLINYQLTFYKHYFAQKHGIDPKNIETHFALLKRTAKKNRVEFVKITSGKRKTQNAINLLLKALYNIKKKNFIKNRLSCKFCEFYKTEHCP